MIGREVEYCHPPRSIHLVRKVISELREGRRSKAEFWTNVAGRLIYITYLPVRGSSGRYLGVLEVVQDITDLKRIKGEKRLLE